MSARCVWNVEASLGEGPLWTAETFAVWFVDINNDIIHRHDTLTGSNTSWPTPPQPGFILPKSSGGFIVGLNSGLHDFDPESGTFTLRQAVEPDIPGNRLNDGHIDLKGRLWFGSMHDAATEPSGSLYRYDQRGLAQMDSGYVITNGPAVSPDGRTLYHTDTLGRMTYAFDLDDDGNLSGKRAFVQPKRGHPDGLAVDSEGGVWSALYGGWGIDRYAPDGSLIAHYPVPASQCTKIAFGGPDLKTIYITTARQNLSAEQLSKQPDAGGLFALDVDVDGLPQYALAV